MCTLLSRLFSVRSREVLPQQVSLMYNYGARVNQKKLPSLRSALIFSIKAAVDQGNLKQILVWTGDDICHRKHNLKQ